MEKIVLTEECIAHEKFITDACWRAGALEYKLLACQRLIYEDLNRLSTDTTYRVRECARGFGKSTGAAIEAIIATIKPPYTYPVYLIAPELKQCVQIFTPILRWIAADAPEGFFQPLRSQNKFRIGNNELILGGFNLDYVDSLRGQRAKRIIVDEARDCDPSEFIYGLRDVMASMVAHSFGVIDILSSTPGDLNHPLVTEIIPEAQINRAHIVRTLDDNETLSEAQKERLIKDLGGRESNRAKRELWCERIRDTAQVICPNFIKSRHVRLSKRPKNAAFLVAADWGGVKDKTVLQIVSYHYDRQKVVIEKELCFEPNTPTKAIVTQAKAWEREHLGEEAERIVDAPGQVIVDLNEMGYQCGPPRKATFIEHVSYLNTMFMDSQLEISPDCPTTIATLEHGKLNKQRTDFERTTALGHCDAVAALIYGVRHIPFYFPPASKTAQDREEEYIHGLEREATSPKDDFDIEQW